VIDLQRKPDGIAQRAEVVHLHAVLPASAAVLIWGVVPPTR
jgi:hypothetical protein